MLPTSTPDRPVLLATNTPSPPAILKYDVFVQYPNKPAPVLRKVELLSLSRLREQLKVPAGSCIVALHPRLHQRFLLEDVKQLSDGMLLTIHDAKVPIDSEPVSPPQAASPHPPKSANTISPANTLNPPAQPSLAASSREEGLDMTGSAPAPSWPPIGSSNAEIMETPDRVIECAGGFGADLACVRSVALCGNVVISGHADSVIRGWDLSDTSGKPQAPVCLEGHTGPVCCLLASPESKMLYSGSADNFVKVWSLREAACVGTLLGHRAPVLCLLQGTSPHSLYSGSEDGTIKIWDLRHTRQCQTTLSGHSDGVTCLLSANGRLISGSLDNSLKVWHISTTQLLQSLDQGHHRGVTGLCQAGDHFYSVSKDKNLREWHKTTFVSPRYMCAHSHWISTIISFSDSLVTSALDGSIKVWNRLSFKMTDTLLGHTGAVNALTCGVVDYNSYLVSGGDDGVKIWLPTSN